MLYWARSSAREVLHMQKRSHTLLASALLRSQNVFDARRYELAFLLGSFQPDCNPLSYLKGSLRAKTFGGHNYTNSHPYIYAHIARLQRRRKAWTVWQYYTLGKLTHYLADAFTYPHNENFPDTMLDHHRYETNLRQYFSGYMAHRSVRRLKGCQELTAALEQLHQQYMASRSSAVRDSRYILRATSLLMAGCLPAA